MSEPESPLNRLQSRSAVDVERTASPAGNNNLDIHSDLSRLPQIGAESEGEILSEFFIIRECIPLIDGVKDEINRVMDLFEQQLSLASTEGHSTKAADIFEAYTGLELHSIGEGYVESHEFVTKFLIGILIFLISYTMLTVRRAKKEYELWMAI